jgi:hypothetical protein
VKTKDCAANWKDFGENRKNATGNLRRLSWKLARTGPPERVNQMIELFPWLRAMVAPGHGCARLCLL